MYLFAFSLRQKGDEKDYREPDLVVDESHVIGIRETSQQPIITGGDSMISQQEPDDVSTNKTSPNANNSLERGEGFPSEPVNSLVTATNTYTPSSSFTAGEMHDESNHLVITTRTSSDTDVTNNDITTNYGVSVSEENTTLVHSHES